MTNLLQEKSFPQFCGKECCGTGIPDNECRMEHGNCPSPPEVSGPDATITKYNILTSFLDVTGLTRWMKSIENWAS
jgi:hypothetical protein